MVASFQGYFPIPGSRAFLSWLVWGTVSSDGGKRHRMRLWSELAGVTCVVRFLRCGSDSSCIRL